MRILFFGKGDRGSACLQALAGTAHDIIGAVVHPPLANNALAEYARRMDIKVFAPDDPNDPQFVAEITGMEADVLALCGYGKILKQPALSGTARHGAINLHGGKLPNYRGSSPLNWALINGEPEVTLSVIRVDTGIDTGDVLMETTVPVTDEDNIATIHARTNVLFPQMLLSVLLDIEGGRVRPRCQADDGAAAGYWPMRFPDDGFLLFDAVTADQALNRIRALTEPYPCAFTFYKGRRVKIIEAKRHTRRFHGEPGRIYRKNAARGLLVATLDEAIWITRAVFQDTGASLTEAAAPYELLSTLKSAAFKALSGEDMV